MEPAAEAETGRAASSGPASQVVITDRAIADIVGWTVLECYGVVGMASPNLVQRRRPLAHPGQAPPGHQGGADTPTI